MKHTHFGFSLVATLVMASISLVAIGTANILAAISAGFGYLIFDESGIQTPCYYVYSEPCKWITIKRYNFMKFVVIQC